MQLQQGNGGDKEGSGRKQMVGQGRTLALRGDRIWKGPWFHVRKG